MSADSGTLAIRRKSDGLELWDAASARLRASITAPTDPGRIGTSDWIFSPDGSALVTRLSDGAINLWDASTGRRRLQASMAVTANSERPTLGANWIAFGGSPVRPFAFSPDSMTLAVACPDGSVHQWGIPSARRATVLQAPVPEFENSDLILFSPDGRFLAVAGQGAPRNGIDRLPAPLRGVFTRNRETPPLGRSRATDRVGSD